MSNVVIRPSIPFWHLIPDGLNVGKTVEIRGTVPYGADIFQINFIEDRDVGHHEGKRIFHMSVRFAAQTIVRNSRLTGSWGAEEKSGFFPFSSGKSFIMLILVEQDKYKVAINGQHCFDFSHRYSYSYAKYLFIDGTVKIDEVQYFGRPGACVPPPSVFPNPMPGTCVPPGCPTPQTIYSPSIPFFYPIPGGLVPGMNIYIQGRPSASVNKFTINLQCGRGPYPPPDIAFHLDVRHPNYTVVRNTRMDNTWGTEERLTTIFPFEPAVNFDIIIRVEHDKYVVTVNGQHFADYRHRLLPLSRVNALYIENDIVVASIRIQ